MTARIQAITRVAVAEEYDALLQHAWPVARYQLSAEVATPLSIESRHLSAGPLSYKYTAESLYY
jgi:hypothetical protein